MKNSVTFYSHGYGCSDILLNGEKVGKITGSHGCYYVMMARPLDGQEVAVARFKYMNPVTKAKNFVREILKYATPSEVALTLGGGDPNRPTPLGWLEDLQSRKIYLKSYDRNLR